MALRIKEGIKLEELEKYGFTPRYDSATGLLTKYIRKVTDGMTIEMVVFCSRSNYITVTEPYGETLDTLYDLITAGIVVKE